ncbi:MAG: NfeD family protein [Acidimicrobiales bacterium]
MTVAGEVWGATASHDEALTKGTKVRITHMQGTRVIVEPVSADESDSREDHQ